MSEIEYTKPVLAMKVDELIAEYWSLYMQMTSLEHLQEAFNRYHLEFAPKAVPTLIQEIQLLRATIDKLPKTADSTEAAAIAAKEKRDISSVNKCG